jgi:hypothetical protein
MFIFLTMFTVFAVFTMTTTIAMFTSFTMSAMFAPAIGYIVRYTRSDIKVTNYSLYLLHTIICRYTTNFTTAALIRCSVAANDVLLIFFCVDIWLYPCMVDQQVRAYKILSIIQYRHDFFCLCAKQCLLN